MTIRTITVPVKDLSAATSLYRSLLGVEPYLDQPYYVGFRPEGSPEVGLDPHGDVTAGPVVFYQTEDIEASITALTSVGSTVEQPAQDVGGGGRTAKLRDTDGNLFGLFQGTAQ